MRWVFIGFPSVTLAVCVILTGGFSLETAKKRTKPDVGHLVLPRMQRLWPTPAIIVDKRGIEVLIMFPDSRRIWVRRNALDVIE